MFEFEEERPLTDEEFNEFRQDTVNDFDNASPMDIECVCLTVEQLQQEKAELEKLIERVKEENTNLMKMNDVKYYANEHLRNENQKLLSALIETCSMLSNFTGIPDSAAELIICKS